MLKGLEKISCWSLASGILLRAAVLDRTLVLDSEERPSFGSERDVASSDSDKNEGYRQSPRRQAIKLGNATTLQRIQIEVSHDVYHAPIQGSYDIMLFQWGS